MSTGGRVALSKKAQRNAELFKRRGRDSAGVQEGRARQLRFGRARRSPIPTAQSVSLFAPVFLT